MMRGLIKLALTAILTVIYFYTNKTHLINLSIWLRSIDLILLNISNIIFEYLRNIPKPLLILEKFYICR